MAVSTPSFVDTDILVPSGRSMLSWKNPPGSPAATLSYTPYFDLTDARNFLASYICCLASSRLFKNVKLTGPVSIELSITKDLEVIESSVEAVPPPSLTALP